MGLFDNELQYGDRPLAVDDQGRTASCQELDVFSGVLYEKTGGKKLIFILCENTLDRKSVV